MRIPTFSGVFKQKPADYDNIHPNKKQEVYTPSGQKLYLTDEDVNTHMMAHHKYMQDGFENRRISGDKDGNPVLTKDKSANHDEAQREYHAVLDKFEKRAP